ENSRLELCPSEKHWSIPSRVLVEHRERFMRSPDQDPGQQSRSYKSTSAPTFPHLPLARRTNWGSLFARMPILQHASRSRTGSAFVQNVDDLCRIKRICDILLSVPDTLVSPRGTLEQMSNRLGEFIHNVEQIQSFRPDQDESAMRRNSLINNLSLIATQIMD